MKNQLAERVAPFVIGEGRVTEINLPLDGAEVGFMNEEDPESPVELTFRDPVTDYYVNIFDHRQRSRKTFLSGDDEAFGQAFCLTPCLVGFRMIEKTQYIKISDIGAVAMRDGGEEERLMLTQRGQYDVNKYRVIVNGDTPARHQATGICLVEPRPKKPVK